MLVRHCLTLVRVWSLVQILLLVLPAARAAPRNVTIENIATQIVYTPFICNATTALTNPGCLGAWYVFNRAHRVLVFGNEVGLMAACVLFPAVGKYRSQQGLDSFLRMVQIP